MAGTAVIERDKAARIVDAMRTSVAARGVAGSTFDHVAREAGVSRGLLHYYFGTKERLLGEVVRRDCELRVQALDARLAGVRSADELMAGMVAELEHLVQDDPEALAVVFELFTLSRRNADLAAEYAALVRSVRDRLGALLSAKAAEGVVELRGEPEVVADVLLSLADGLALRMLTERERDWRPTVDAAVAAVRALLT